MKISIKNFIFFIISNIIILLFLEIIFTLFFVYHSSNYYGPLARIFYSTEVKKQKINIYKIKRDKSTQKMLPGVYDNNGIEFTVNSRGFIGDEFSVKNETGCRIISFGGSTTLGIETKNPYPKILEEKLIKNKFNCEVLNFGFSGKGLNYIENLLVNEAINYSPNIITIMSNRNSVMYDSYGSSSISPDVISSNFDFYYYKLKKFIFSEIMTYRFLDLASKRVLSLFYDKENKILSPYDSNTYHFKNYFVSKYENQLKNIINFSKKNNIKVVLVKQAHYLNIDQQKKLKLLSKEQVINKLLNYNKEKSNNKINLFWSYTNAILNKSLDKIKLEYPDVIVVDPTEEIYAYEKEINFLDNIHLTSHGNEIVPKNIMFSIVNDVKVLTKP